MMTEGGRSPDDQRLHDDQSIVHMSTDSESDASDEEENSSDESDASNDESTSDDSDVQMTAPSSRGLNIREGVCTATFIMPDTWHSVNALTVPWFLHFVKPRKEIVTRSGIVIHFLELELYGLNITRVVQAMLQAMLQAHVDVDVPKGSINRRRRRGNYRTK